MISTEKCVFYETDMYDVNNNKNIMFYMFLQYSKITVFLHFFFFFITNITYVVNCK